MPQAPGPLETLSRGGHNLSAMAQAQRPPNAVGMAEKIQYFGPRDIRLAKDGIQRKHRSRTFHPGSIELGNHLGWHCGRRRPGPCPNDVARRRAERTNAISRT